MYILYVLIEHLIEKGEVCMKRSVESARSWLFVPASRPDRYDRAVAAADIAIVDLEDAVEEGGKAAARDELARWVRSGGRAAVRINSVGSREHDADLAWAGEHDLPVVLPKVADVAQAESVVARLGIGRVVLLIESADGVLRSADLAQVPGVARIALGNADLGAELGVDPTDRMALQMVRSQLVLASAVAGLASPIDGVTLAIADGVLLADDLDHARRLGFTGKLCIHPAQVAAVEGAFSPTPDEVAWARSVLDATGLAVIDGSMVDRPVILRAQSILSRLGTLS
jgi:citrate lyase subunit beta / citryl-CoA lyase